MTIASEACNRTIKAIMMETGTEDTVSPTGETEEKRLVKPTLKILEHNLQSKISSRRAILGQLTEKRNKVHALMDDDANVENISSELLAKYETLLKEFSKINEEVKDLFCQIECVENMVSDQRDWFEPRNNDHINYVQTVKEWIHNAILRREEANKISDEIRPGSLKGQSPSLLLLQHLQLVLSV